jgi:hypothetical protein
MSAKGLSDMATCESCGCETGTELAHADYPHEPGRLYDCPACEDHCHCKPGETECIFEGEHNGLAETEPAAKTETQLRTEQEAARREAFTPVTEPSYGPNADGNPYAQYTPEHRVWVKAQENGKAAASWVFDGNTDKDTYRKVLQGIDDGDPEVMDGLYPGSLRGGYTDRDILADAKWVPHDGTSLRDELIEQYDREIVDAFWNEVERQAVEQLKEDPDDLNDRMDFDHVIKVDGRGIVTEPGGYAPELVMFVDEDGSAMPDSDEQLHEQAKSAGWRLLSGWTGQYRYSGPVMHPSEYVGGALARSILETPGEYVVTMVSTLAEDEADDDEEPAGWAIAFREAGQ